MKSVVELLLVAFVVSSFKLTAAWRPYRIHHYNVSAYSLSDKVYFNASINNLETVSMFLEVKSELQRPFIRFEVYVDSGNGLIDLKYINETVDMCRLFRNKFYMPFLQIIYRILTDQGNYPASCPIKRNKYKAENTKVDIEKLPPTIPSKTISIAAIASIKEGSTMKPLFVYRVIVKIVKI